MGTEHGQKTRSRQEEEDELNAVAPVQAGPIGTHDHGADQQQQKQFGDTSPGAVTEEQRTLYMDLIARVRQIVQGIDIEDSTAGDMGGAARAAKPSGQRVRDQIAGPLATAQRHRERAAWALDTGNRTVELLAQFETSVQALERAYLDSNLISTDTTIAPGEEWRPTGDRARLREATRDQLSGWQSSPADEPWVKFAVPPRDRTDGNLEIRVGSKDLSHGEIAGGPAIAAGILSFDFSGAGRPRVHEMENVSGGFRPGPLRNTIAREAVAAAGYTLADDFTEHRDATGAYGGSVMYAHGQQLAEPTEAHVVPMEPAARR